jgi:hypothetical protein
MTEREPQPEDEKHTEAGSGELDQESVEKGVDKLEQADH